MRQEKSIQNLHAGTMSVPARHWTDQLVDELLPFLSDDDSPSPLARHPSPLPVPGRMERQYTAPSTRVPAVLGLPPAVPPSGWVPSPDSVAWVKRVTMDGQRIHIRRQQDLVAGRHELGGRPKTQRPRGRNTLASTTRRRFDSEMRVNGAARGRGKGGRKSVKS